MSESTSSTVSGTFELDYGTGTLLDLTPERKAALTRQLSAQHKDATLSDVEHTVVEDNIGHSAKVKVTAKAAPKK